MTTPRLAVLGSGLMGIGIAVHLARHGHAVQLQDVDPARLAEVAATARTLLAELEEADIAVDTEAVIARLSTTTELADLADCDLLFEAVPERLELKHIATSRQTFASGAMRAAKWLEKRKPGLYGINDVLGLD